MRFPSRRILRWLTIPVLAGLLAVAAFQVGFRVPTAKALDPTAFTEEQDKLMSEFAYYELSNANATLPQSQQPTSYATRGSDACPTNLSSNIKVNQNCLNLSDPDLAGRAQAQNETTVAIDPNNTNHIVAAYNDYRRGDGNCYAAYSLDKGRTWNDSTVPMSFVRGAQFNAAREYFEAGGDPSVAWDSKGNVYYTCQMFSRGRPTTPSPDASSAVYVFRSTQNNGASWNFPGRPVVEFNDITGSSPVLEDKPYMTIDNNAGSPFQDRIYVAWTEFAADGSAYIWESYSSDYGEHFSPRHLVSVTSSLCTVTYGAGTPYGSCNENQFANPFTGPDGALYVVYNNYNNAVKGQDNRNQMLLSKSTDGGNTFVGPIKVSDYYDLPDCATYQNGKDFGRACVPEKGPTANSIFRATNYPTGAVNPTNPSQVVVTFGSYINQHSNEANGCVPAGFNPATGNNLFTGVKTPGACNNDILISVSNDGGATFTGTTADPRDEPVVTQDAGQTTTDQWWQWEAFTKNGKLAVSYYDRQYGTDETTGYSDMSLSGSGDLASFVVNRVTSGSMPPPTQFGGLFFGDYSALAADTNAYPVWMDTRDPELFTGAVCGTTVPTTCTATYSNGLTANDQDIFTAALSVPSK